MTLLLEFHNTNAILFLTFATFSPTAQQQHPKTRNIIMTLTKKSVNAFSGAFANNAFGANLQGWKMALAQWMGKKGP